MLLPRRLTIVAPVLLLLSGCAYDYAQGYAPNYPPGYDNGIGSGDIVQPGDLFGGQNIASVELFYEPLARYGRWADTRFGYAFIPAVQDGWRPYVNGRWGDNRLWISADPWGWATDHYGRWGFDDRAGWVWVPGTEWAPSWVAWREDDQVAGWAPIPPGVSYSVSVGIGGGFGGGYDDWNNWYGPSWVWVQRPNLYRPGFGGGPLPWERGRDYWRTSQWQRGSAWNGRPGYGGGNRPGTSRPDYQRPENGREGRRDENWQGRPRPDGTANQWQGRPRPDGTANQWQGRPRPDGTANQWQGRPRPDGTANQWQGRPRPDGTANQWQGRPDRQGSPTGQPQYQPRPQPPQGGGVQSRPDAATSEPRSPPRGNGNGGAGGGMYRAPPQAQPQAQPAPQRRAEPPAQRPPAPARENQNERPD